MTTITAANLATVRRRSGDSNQPYDLTDAEVDAVYTDTTRGNLDLRMTAFYVLLERLGVATNAVAISNPSGGITRNQKFDQIMRLLQLFYPAELEALGGNIFGESGFAEWSYYDASHSP